MRKVASPRKGVLYWALILGLVMMSSYGTAQAAEEPTTNGILIHGERADPGGLDPHTTSGSTSYMISLLLYDTLLALTPDGELAPLLAKSWEISDDQLTYTFNLRDDVVFHSGKALTASDVKFSLERILDPATASPWVALVQSIDTVETRGDHTVIVHLIAPDRLFLVFMSNPSIAILNSEFTSNAGDAYGQTIVDGTGPFKLVSREPATGIVFERYEGYTWGPEWYENRGPARLARVEWRFIPELATRQLMIERGEIDTITHNSEPAVYERADRLAGTVNITLRPVNETRSLFIDSAYPKLSDVAVRRAIALAVPAEQIAEALYAPLGERALNVIHHTEYTYDPSIGVDLYGYDLARAREVLDAAGWVVGSNGYRTKDGVELSGIPLMGLPQYEPIGLIIQENLAEIGIGVDVQMMERGFLYPLRGTGDVPMEIRNNRGVPEVYASWLLSENYPGSNPFGWKDEHTDQLIATFLASPHEEEALAAAHELQRLMQIDEVLIHPIYWTSDINLVNARTIRDFEGSSWGNTGLGKLLDTWSLRVP